MNIGYTLLGQAITFAVLIWFTMKFIWPPLLNAIKERQQKIADGLAAAEKARSELKDADARIAEEVRKARQQASEIIDRAQQQGNQIIEQAKAEAQQEIERQKQIAQDEVAQMAQQARDQLRQQVGALALAGAEKIVQREIDPATHKALIDQLAAEI
ncbi:MAG TPA: F0F1 ATP synthase subunit B [Rhodanobacteraceae bacterium]|nr:F0F1 ATP synthase subunit B [Rhodanobacteraceae bacterium]